MQVNFAYTGQGKLFYVQDGKAREIESEFAQEMQDRAMRVQQSRSWKNRDEPTMFGGRSLWGISPSADQPLQIEITSAAKAGNSLYYFLQTRQVGALCRYDLEEKEERRIFHRENFHGRDLAHHPEEDKIAFALQLPDGTSNIAVMPTETRDQREVTEGDGVDMAPAWIPGSKTRLVFQSAGVARAEEGYIVGLGPFAINTLDTESGELTTELEDAQHDLLSPRYDGAGNLYFIRRPYEGMGRPGFQPLTMLTDIVFFPFRLLVAFFHFLNAFSLFFAKKPLTNADGPRNPPVKVQRVELWGKMIDLQKLTNEHKTGEIPSLVPATWELVKRAPDGIETILARNVASFDLTPAGEVVYSNGRKARWIGNDSAGVSAASGLMERVLVV